MDSIIAFAKDNNLEEPEQEMLKDFAEFLEKNGKLVPDGDLKAHFIESRTVRDVNKKNIIVSSCIICGNSTYEVKEED